MSGIGLVSGSSESKPPNKSKLGSFGRIFSSLFDGLFTSVIFNRSTSFVWFVFSEWIWPLLGETFRCGHGDGGAAGRGGAGFGGGGCFDVGFVTKRKKKKSQ